MKKALLVLPLLIFLYACGSEDSTTGLAVSDISNNLDNQLDGENAEANITVTEIIPSDPCENVTCVENERCVEGSCFCDFGFKQCNSACILQDQCCSDSDCGDRNSCVNGSCTQTIFCKFNEKWDSGQKKCVCTDSAKWCYAQKKCIPKGNCCDETICNPRGGTIESRCMPTIAEADICVRGGNSTVEKHCKKAKENARNNFNLGGLDYDIFIEGAYEQDEIDLKIVHKGKEELLKKIKVNDIKNTPFDVAIDYAGIISKGGNCENAD